MSNLIPGNQKHLTLQDRKFIEDSLNENLRLKRLLNTFAKILLLFQKRYVFIAWMILTPNGYLITHTTSAPKDFDSNVHMSAKRSFFATLTVLPA